MTELSVASPKSYGDGFPMPDLTVSERRRRDNGQQEHTGSMYSPYRQSRSPGYPGLDYGERLRTSTQRLRPTQTSGWIAPRSTPSQAKPMSSTALPPWTGPSSDTTPPPDAAKGPRSDRERAAGQHGYPFLPTTRMMML